MSSAIFIDELKGFAVGFARLQAGTQSRRDATILEDLFGGRPAAQAVHQGVHWGGLPATTVPAGGQLIFRAPAAIPAAWSAAITGDSNEPTPRSSSLGQLKTFSGLRLNDVAHCRRSDAAAKSPSSKTFASWRTGAGSGYGRARLRPIGQTYRIRIVYFRRAILSTVTLANPYVPCHVLDPAIGVDPREHRATACRISTGTRPRSGISGAVPCGPAETFMAARAPIAEPSSLGRSNGSSSRVLAVRRQIGEAQAVTRAAARRMPDTGPEPSPEDRARRERSRNAAFHSLGRKIGVFGSYPLMGAASAGVSRRRSGRA